MQQCLIVVQISVQRSDTVSFFTPLLNYTFKIHTFYVTLILIVQILRLRAYDRNTNFQNDPILLPEPLEVEWRTNGLTTDTT